MSWQPVEDINEKILNIRKRMLFKKDTISCPDSTGNHLEDIVRDSNNYKNAFEKVRQESKIHQEGGKICEVLSPDNMPVQTTFMKLVLREQTEKIGRLEGKRKKTFDRRTEIEEGKGKKEKEIRQLYAEMMQDFSEKKRCLDEALHHRDG